MENSKPSTSYEGSYISRQQRIDLLEKCKACNKTFDDNSILKHITHMDSCKAEYNESELDYIRGWSKKRKNYKCLFCISILTLKARPCRFW